MFTTENLKDVIALVRVARAGGEDGRIMFSALIPRNLKGAQIQLTHAVCVIDSLVEAQADLLGIDREVR